MATSDIFSDGRQEKRSRYLVSGAGGILFLLPVGTLYDKRTEEEIAFFNARKIDCALYRRTPDGEYFKVLSPGEYEKVDRKTVVRSSFMHREMLNNTQYVPGIQMLMP